MPARHRLNYRLRIRAHSWAVPRGGVVCSCRDAPIRREQSRGTSMASRNGRVVNSWNFPEGRLMKAIAVQGIFVGSRAMFPITSGVLSAGPDGVGESVAGWTQQLGELRHLRVAHA